MKFNDPIRGPAMRPLYVPGGPTCGPSPHWLLPWVWSLHRHQPSHHLTSQGLVPHLPNKGSRPCMGLLKRPIGPYPFFNYKDGHGNNFTIIIFGTFFAFAYYEIFLCKLMMSLIWIDEINKILPVIVLRWWRCLRIIQMPHYIGQEIRSYKS